MTHHDFCSLLGPAQTQPRWGCIHGGRDGSKGLSQITNQVSPPPFWVVADSCSWDLNSGSDWCCSLTVCRVLSFMFCIMCVL